MTLVRIGDSCSIELKICEQCLPTLEGRRIQVPKTLLELDAKTSVFGETFAGFLLGRIKGGDEWIHGLAEKYRLRVIVEEILDLMSVIDGLVEEASIKPLYPPFHRANLLEDPYLGVLTGSANIGEEYEAIMDKYGLRVGDKIAIDRIRKTRKRIRMQTRRFFALVSVRLGRISRRIASTLLPRIREISCRDTVASYDPSTLVILPEGKYYEGRAQHVLEQSLATPLECQRPNMLSSSLICKTPEKEIVIKRYTAREAKWLPASLVSPERARLAVSASKRVAREYVMLRRIREVVETPRIIAIIREPTGPAMAREYVPGKPVLGSDDEKDWELAGETLARLHRHGYALLDSNPGNFVINDDKVYVIDAEQADTFSLDAGAWDLIVFVVYSLFFGVSKNLIQVALRRYKTVDPELYEKLRVRIDGAVGSRLRFIAYPLYSQAVRLINSV